MSVHTSTFLSQLFFGHVGFLWFPSHFLGEVDAVLQLHVVHLFVVGEWILETTQAQA